MSSAIEETTTECDFCSADTNTAAFWVACGALSTSEEDRNFGSNSHERKDGIEIWNLHICHTCAFTRYVDIFSETQTKAPFNFWGRLLLGPSLLLIGAMFNSDFGAYAFGVPGFFLTILGWATAPAAWREFQSHRGVPTGGAIPIDKAPEVNFRAAEDYQKNLLSNGATRTHLLPNFKPKQNLTTIQKLSILAVAFTPAELLENLDSEWKALYANSIGS